MSAAMEAISALPDDDDHELLLGVIEGQSEIFELLDKIVEWSIADKKLAELARERATPHRGKVRSGTGNRHAHRGGPRGEPA